MFLQLISHIVPMVKCQMYLFSVAFLLYDMSKIRWTLLPAKNENVDVILQVTVRGPVVQVQLGPRRPPHQKLFYLSHTCLWQALMDVFITVLIALYESHV